jgi:putative addiction module component (TIGR02574 family)
MLESTSNRESSMNSLVTHNGSARLHADHSLDTESVRAKVAGAMPLTPEELAAQAMELPTEARAQLAEMLIDSLDPIELADIERQWAAEAVRRGEEMRSGAVKPLPADDVFQEILNELKR